MVNVGEQNYTTNITEFYADDPDDLKILPTLTSSGKENLSTINSVGIDSSCFVISTSEVYMLQGSTNTWVKI